MARKRPDLTVCWACRTPTLRGEQHHFVPKRAGGGEGANLVPLCVVCHDFVDRIPLNDTFSWVCLQEHDEPAPRWANLLMMKYAAIFYDHAANDQMKESA